MSAALKPEPTTKGAVPFLVVPKDGAAPYLAGSKCGKCGEVVAGTRLTCGKCGARAGMAHVKLGSTGTLYNFTVVYRNFPGVPVPFISAIVDVDGGGTLKGNLLGVEPDPAKIRFDLPVNIVIRPVPQKDKDGNSYLAYFFEPRA
ncbi:MAG: OB-fold domain-containing protein [Rhizomicrobium sp.]